MTWSGITWCLSIKHKNELRSLPRRHRCFPACPAVPSQVSCQRSVIWRDYNEDPIPTSRLTRALNVGPVCSCNWEPGLGFVLGGDIQSHWGALGRGWSSGVTSQGHLHGVWRTRRNWQPAQSSRLSRNLALFVLGQGQLLVPARFNYPGLTNLFSMTHAGKMTVSFSQFPHLLFVFLSLPSQGLGRSSGMWSAMQTEADLRYRAAFIWQHS